MRYGDSHAVSGLEPEQSQRKAPMAGQSRAERPLAPAKSTHPLETSVAPLDARLPIKDLGVMELRKELKKRGLSPSGLKVPSGHSD